MSKSMMSQKGAVLTEFVLAIAIIGILTSLAIMTYSGATRRSRANAVTVELKNVTEALDLYAQKSNWTVWPKDDTLEITNTATADPLLSMMIADKPLLKNYLPAAPKISGLPALQWRYDNNDDVHNPAVCDVLLTNGVNIWIEQIGDTALAQIIDANLDDGNVNCGMLRYNPGAAGGRLMYCISKTSTIQ